MCSCICIAFCCVLLFSIALFISPPPCHAAFIASPAPASFVPLNYSVLVYGSSSAAVTAAVASARNRVTTVLVSPFPHLGGLSSSGLGKTDTGQASTIGGLANRFYRLVGAHYERETAVYEFEPHVAELVFDELVADQQPYIRLLTGYAVDSVALSDDASRILSMDVTDIASLSSTLTLSASVFIDASYEGDLLRVLPPFTFGREARRQYNESLAGITPNPDPSSNAGNQLNTAVDPWLIPNDTSSGLLPLVDGLWEGHERVGQADDYVQCINYRLCLTTNKSNSVPFSAPADYDFTVYELYRRYISAANLSSIDGMFNIGELPHYKFDFNNAGGASTDVFFNNAALNYILASPLSDTRAKLTSLYRDFTRGLLYFLSHSPLLPASVTADMSRYGLCADEFVDNDYWPYQLYVREGLRLADPMRVMTQHDVDKDGAAAEVDDGIALGSYNMDSHNVRRVAVWQPRLGQWTTKNEGDVQVKPARGAYLVPFSSMARQAEGMGAANLLIPVCLGGTHVAVSSVRMEPVYMMLGEAAGEAAAMLVEQAASNATVQTLPMHELRGRLRKHGAILDPNTTASAVPHFATD